MPSITYGGVRYNQIRHAIQCKKCLDTIVSESEHDFKMCSCGAVGVDGGLGPNRILGSVEDIADRRVYMAIIEGKKIFLPRRS